MVWPRRLALVSAPDTTASTTPPRWARPMRYPIATPTRLHTSDEPGAISAMQEPLDGEGCDSCVTLATGSQPPRGLTRPSAMCRDALLDGWRLACDHPQRLIAVIRQVLAKRPGL